MFRMRRRDFSSARASRVGGTSSPSALAVLRLITNSNLVGCSIGKSAGFAPRKILSTLIANAPALAKLALQQRLPSSGWPDYAVAGGLIGYGVSFPDLFRRAATFVDKILKGAKPADLPVERAAKFETIVNLKIAKALGLDMPTAILLRADEVIE